MGRELHITKIEKGRLRIFRPDCKLDSVIILDFNPIIKEHNLSGHFCLLHYQGIPFGLREWGIYDGFSDNYYSFRGVLFSCSYCLTPERWGVIEIDEIKHKVRPSSVVVFYDSIIRKEKEKYILFPTV
jgi:hypothetical protein